MSVTGQVLLMTGVAYVVGVIAGAAAVAFAWKHEWEERRK